MGPAGRAAACSAALLLFLSPAALFAVPPRPAPSVYASHIYVLTFRTPPGATYCPLPADWVGSDHGTTIFLERPRDCGGAGYPSSSRGFTPGTVARISLFYAYQMPDPLPPVRCRAIGSLRFLGGTRRLCRTNEDGMISIRVGALYLADIPAEAILTLYTRPARLARDLAIFRRVAASLATCRATWRGPRGTSRYGAGAPCGRFGTF